MHYKSKIYKQQAIFFEKNIYTVEPRYNEVRGPWDHENYLVRSDFSLYQGNKNKEI